VLKEHGVMLRGRFFRGFPVSLPAARLPKCSHLGGLWPDVEIQGESPEESGEILER